MKKYKNKYVQNDPTVFIKHPPKPKQHYTTDERAVADFEIKWFSEKERLGYKDIVDYLPFMFVLENVKPMVLETTQVTTGLYFKIKGNYSVKNRTDLIKCLKLLIRSNDLFRQHYVVDNRYGIKIEHIRSAFSGYYRDMFRVLN